MQSMTGFGRGTASGRNYEITVEVQSVNRRNLETSFSLPKEWASLEPVLTEAIKEVAQRGRVHTTVAVSKPSESAGLSWDEGEVMGTLARIDGLANRLGCPWPPDADLILRVILALQGSSGMPAVEEAEPIVKAAAETALEAFRAMRATEGEALTRDFESRIGLLGELLDSIKAEAAGRPEAYRALLLERLKSAGLELELEDERVLKEVALFADRCDVAEEVTRLTSHLSQFLDTVKSSAGAMVGRKLEFLLQEILREFNTIGSKANKLEVTKQVIEAKNEIERIREQVQNVE